MVTFILLALAIVELFFFVVFKMQPEVVVDMKQRYVGHCNVGTDIKQASFLGQRGILFIISYFHELFFLKTFQLIFLLVTISINYGLMRLCNLYISGTVLFLIDILLCY